jgi:MSHA biogenesis protein MshO
VRVSGGTALEFINTVDGGRYRADFSSTGGGDPLDFAALSDGFDVLGDLAAATPAAVTTGAGSTQACDGTRACVIISNTGFPANAADANTAGSSNNAYLGPGTGNCVPGATWCGNVATLAGINTSFASFDNTGLAAWHFPSPSSRQRFYIANGPVSYVCDTGAGNLRRYAGYALAAVQAVPPAGATANNILTNRVTGCAFTYNAGTATREALVSISLTLTGDSGQSVTLHQQAHVSNEP